MNTCNGCSSLRRVRNTNSLPHLEALEQDPSPAAVYDDHHECKMLNVSLKRDDDGNPLQRCR